MIASLPMYDREETRAAQDRLWRNFQRNFDGTAPRLTRRGNPWDHWTNSGLFLSQTCGLPYRARLHDKVTLVGTPVHDLPCAAGHYYSVIVSRSDMGPVPEEPSLAVNDPLSQSGWAAAHGFAQDQGLAYSRITETGAHVASAKAVAEGRADLAAIDAVTWKLIQRFEDFSSDLAVIDQTPPTPALPYITRAGAEPAPLYDALARAIDALAPEDQDLLCLKGLTRIEKADYLAMPLPPKPF